ncbi:perlucin c protein [Plakobranchus ocellatus]|uniref:Perlucin c protein n=1 Tax=Plakobranchus ocellatus TaxID=259542 RepID=A0AAV4CHN0_9GAST|nr:perlucin c protein [Plakobranchus ocellatus]
MMTMIILLIVAFAINAKGMTSAINLDVSHTNDPTTQSGLIVVNCSVDVNLTDIVTVASLTVFGSKPYGNQGDFDELAVVDIWSQTPKLSNDIHETGLDVNGNIDLGNAYLAMSWHSPTPGYRQYYKCVANGLDRHRQAASISTTVRVEILTGGCCEKMGSIDSQLRKVSEKVGNTCTAQTAAALTVQVKNLHSKIEALDSKIDGQIEILGSKLDGKIEALDSKLETFQSNVNRQLKMMTIDKGSFDVSDISKGRVYLASKAQAAFNIGAANQACKSSGGYLVELDDDEEYQFVYDFVTRTGGANNFFTGGNDIDREGQFVYFNSKKSVPSLTKWAPGQPNNHGGSEDCMEIRLSLKGLNDWICSATGKFVCEVELY